MKTEQAPELPERALVVVHAQVDENVGEPGIPLLRPHDEERCGLLAPAVTSCCLCGVEAVEEALRERLVAGRFEGLGECVHGLRRDEDVALRRVAVAHSVAGP